MIGNLFQSLQLKDQKIHVFRLHVEQMQYVKKEMVLDHVHVYQSIMEILILAADQSVLQMRIVI